MKVIAFQKLFVTLLRLKSKEAHIITYNLKLTTESNVNNLYMKRKKLILLFCILFSMAVTNALAYDFAVKNADSVMIYYNYINNKAEVEVTYKGIEYYDVYCGSVVIPKDVTYEKKTLKVTGIGKLAFHNSQKLTFVTIPNSVTSIGWAALEGCSSLTSITIPNSVTSIGPDAFSRCSSLTSITIPNSVTSIDDWAFSECSSLTSVTIGNGITNIAHMCFKDCSSLSSITIPNSVTSIGTLAFENCSSLTSINIPNSVTSIGINTFRNCSSLTSITIPNSVTSIGTTTFSGCDNLQKVISKIVAPFAIKDHTFSDETYSNVPLYVPKGTKAKYKTTNGWKNFKNIIEEGTTTGIDAVEADKIPDTSKGIYDINGKRLPATSLDELPSGLYIINGKKVVK